MPKWRGHPLKIPSMADADHLLKRSAWLRPTGHVAVDRVSTHPVIKQAIHFPLLDCKRTTRRVEKKAMRFFLCNDNFQIQERCQLSILLASKIPAPPLPWDLVPILDLKRHNCLLFLQYHKGSHLFYCGSKGRKLLKTQSERPAIWLSDSQISPLVPALPWGNDSRKVCWEPQSRGEGGHPEWSLPTASPSQQLAKGGEGSPCRQNLEDQRVSCPIHGWED